VVRGRFGFGRLFGIGFFGVFFLWCFGWVVVGGLDVGGIGRWIVIFGLFCWCGVGWEVLQVICVF